MSEDLGGPYLSAALICERVLQEHDGVLSAIRIVDRIIQQAQAIGTALPESMPSVDMLLFLLLSWKGGASRGRSQVKITLQEPSGLMSPMELSQSIQFEGEDRGANIVLGMQLRLAKEGVYWFNVHLDDRLVTRVPLRLTYQQVQATRAGGAGA